MPEKYATYVLEDFVQDEAFIRWVKYPDPERNLFWNSLLETYPFQQETIDQAKQIVLRLSEATRISVEEEDAQAIWNDLQQSLNKTGRVVPLWQRAWVRIAAATVLLIGGLAIWQLRDEEIDLMAVGSTTYGVLIGELMVVSNEAADAKTVKLPDNSRITLSRGARIRYKTGFIDSSIREVYLTGEAFFEVTRNPQKPFVVYTNEIVTKVLGTSFWVKANAAGKQVTVSVKTGKVFVYKKTKATPVSQPIGVVLLPNQKADYKTASDRLSHTLVDDPLPVLPASEQRPATFNNSLVADLFDTLEKAYGVEIQYNRNLLTSCRLTTSFTNESLYQRLDVLCEAIGATYKIDGTRIVVDAKQCQ